MSRLALLLAWLAFCGAAAAQEAPPKGELHFGPGIGTVTAGGTMLQILYRVGFGRCPECGG